MRVASCTLDRDWRIVHANRRAEALFGRAGSELIGRSFWEQCPAALGRDLEGLYRDAAAVGVDLLFEVRDESDGRWYEIEVDPVPGGLDVDFGDVTERRRGDEEQARLLAASERQRRTFETALSNTPDFHFLLDLEGRITYANASLLELWRKSLDEVVGREFFELDYPPDLAARLAAQARQAVRARRAVGDETSYLSHLGEREYEYVLVPALGADGEVEAVAGSARDITDRKRAERALRESEARFRHLADAMPLMVWVTRPDRSVEFLNRRWLDYTGQSAESCLGPADWARAIHPDDLARVLEASVRSHQEDQPFEAEYRVRAASGAYRWHLGRAVPVFDEAGRVLRRFGAATDIEDRKRVERDARFLADAGATLAAIVDEASTLQKVADLAVPFFADWVAVDMAGEGGAICRLAVAHVDPAKVELAREIHRRYPPDPDAPGGVPAVIRTGESRMVAEIDDAMIVAGARDADHLRILRELGLVSYMGVPLKGRAGTLGAISFIAAESGRRYGPGDLRLAEDLASRAAIAVENARLYAELREADRRKDEFLATLAHELRNPLAPIRNALRLMSTGGLHAMEPERAMAERQVIHLARLIDDLMDVARISRGQIELHKEVVDLSRVIGQAVETARGQLDDRRHRLTVAMPEGATRLEADPTRLEQVFWNLLNNAAKYTDPGGSIDLTVERDGGEVVVRVGDSGIGIGPEMLPRVFEMFVQVGDHRSHAQGGLGIGLSLVRTLVEMHGGAISARSDGPGLGSEFAVRLPVLDRSTAAEDRPGDDGRDPSTMPERRRILVVDDNVDAARSLARLLSRAYRQDVRVAHDGPEALAVAGEFLPEVVLLDIGLPGMDGYEVARRLRERPEPRPALLLALTGWGQEDDLARSKEAGFDHHLVKPADPDRIRDLLLGLEPTSSR